MSRRTAPNPGIAHIRVPTDNLTRQSLALEGPGTLELELLNRAANQTHAPYTWGYTIYRATSVSISDERFDQGLERLEDWVRWLVRLTRYDGNEILAQNVEWNEHPEWWPSANRRSFADDVAERMWNEVVDEYPGQEDVPTAAADGEENFAAVGRAFVAAARQPTEDDTFDNYTRNDLCLIVDDKALRSLEELPREVPGLEPPPPGEWSGYRSERQTMAKAWVWMLDREYLARWEAGIAPRPQWMGSDEEPYKPWTRVRLTHLYETWFQRPLGHVVTRWHLLQEEDRDLWWSARVQWYASNGRTINEVRRRRRMLSAQGSHT